MLRTSIRFAAVLLVGLLLLDSVGESLSCEDAPGTAECHACCCGTHVAPVMGPAQAAVPVAAVEYGPYLPSGYAFLGTSSFFHPPRTVL